jgi:hypothetical protein
VEFEHVLGGVYDFTTTGAGVYEIVPTREASTFTHVTIFGELVSLHADIADVHSATLTGNLTTAASVGTSAKRTPLCAQTNSFVGCSSSQRRDLKMAAVNAQTYADNAYNYLINISAVTEYVSHSLKISLKSNIPNLVVTKLGSVNTLRRASRLSKPISATFATASSPLIPLTAPALYGMSTLMCSRLNLATFTSAVHSGRLQRQAPTRWLGLWSTSHRTLLSTAVLSKCRQT